MANINNNDIVKAEYNTGIYIGRVIEERRNAFLIEVHAVLKHPTQGDLHNPGKVDGVAFHERKALAFTEKTNAPKRRVTLYEDDVPPYLASLTKAVEYLKETLNHEDTPYNQAALLKLTSLEEHFYNKMKS